MLEIIRKRDNGVRKREEKEVIEEKKKTTKPRALGRGLAMGLGERDRSETPACPSGGSGTGTARAERRSSGRLPLSPWPRWPSELPGPQTTGSTRNPMEKPGPGETKQRKYVSQCVYYLQRSKVNV